MKKASFEYILRTVQQTNILPLTSSCTMGCIFCSHMNNPADIEVYSLPNLSFDEMKEISEFLDGSRKIVIGESASRIIEGEPFLRKDILHIIKHIRNKFPSTPVEITTNGVFLTDEVVRQLKELEPVEVNVSLNSSSEEGRRLLYRAKSTSGALDGVKYLNRYNIIFNGSIVAMPHVVGYKDIENTIAFLSLNGARTVRVFVPGFSKLSPYNVDFSAIREKLCEIGDSIYKAYRVPVFIEPPDIRDLQPEVCGVIKHSPAFKSGILKDDVILKVDEYIPAARVDAYNTLYKKANPRVRIKRNDAEFDAAIEKKSNESSGAVFYYDIDPDTIYSIGNAINSCRSKTPLIVTSELAYPVIKLGVERFLGNVEICAVQNKWFGGTIMCSGLLAVNDIIDSLSYYCSKNKKPDLIIVPMSPFDVNGRDLAGHSFYEIEEALNIKTVIAE